MVIVAVAVFELHPFAEVTVSVTVRVVLAAVIVWLNPVGPVSVAGVVVTGFPAASAMVQVYVPLVVDVLANRLVPVNINGAQPVIEVVLSCAIASGYTVMLAVRSLEHPLELVTVRVTV